MGIMIWLVLKLWMLMDNVAELNSYNVKYTVTAKIALNAQTCLLGQGNSYGWTKSYD